MILIVSGSRDGYDQATVDNVLDQYRSVHPDLTILEGCQRGVDQQVEDWARRRGAKFILGRAWPWKAKEPLGLVVAHFPAEWYIHRGCWCSPSKATCNFAGHRRNLEMLDVRPDEVLCIHPALFSASRGTLHMHDEAKRRGITVNILGARA